MRLLVRTLALALGLVVVGSKLVVLAGQDDTFKDAKLNVQKGDKSDQVDVVLRYEPAALVIAHKKDAVKTITYKDVKTAEYSYAKSPRWKTGLLVSPLFFFTSGKKHWLMIQAGESDFAVLQLDKGNYRMIVAELEAKIGRKVDVVGEK
jgi:hypothetical protein